MGGMGMGGLSRASPRRTQPVPAAPTRRPEARRQLRCPQSVPAAANTVAANHEAPKRARFTVGTRAPVRANRIAAPGLLRARILEQAGDGH